MKKRGAENGMRRTRTTWCCLAVTAVAAALMTLLPGAGEAPAQRVATTRVSLGTVERVLALSGRVRYATEYAALTPVTGRVAEVYVTQGQRVYAGQPLFRMDGEAQEAAVMACLGKQAGTAGMDTAALPSAAQAYLDTETTQELALSQAALNALTVRAQVDGLVQQVSVTAHSGAAAGSVAMALSGEEQRIAVTAAQRDAEKLQPGQRARILVKGEKQTWATVVSIAPAATDATTGQVTCEVTLSPDESLSLPLGAQVEAEVSLLRAQQVPTVPLTALTPEGGVWWVEDGRAWTAEHAVIAQDEVCAWVALPEGIQVVTSAAEPLTQGIRVKEEAP